MTEKNIPPDKWYDSNISYKLNLLENNNSIQILNNLNFGDAKHNSEYTQSFEYYNRCDKNFNLSLNKQIDYEKEKQKLINKLNKSINTIKSKNISKKETESKIKTITTKINKKIENISKVILVKRYYIKPTKEQKEIFAKWFNKCTKVYNYCVDKYKKEPELFKKNYMELKKIIFDEIYQDNDKGCPYAILTDEVKTFCQNLKSANTNLTNGNIKEFDIKYKNTSKTQCIFISADSVKNKSFYSTLLGKNINGLENLIGNNVKNDCRLFFNKLYKRYILIVPENIDRKVIKNRELIVAVDPR